jgi:hypothetical protein
LGGGPQSANPSYHHWEGWLAAPEERAWFAEAGSCAACDSVTVLVVATVIINTALVQMWNLYISLAIGGVLVALAPLNELAGRRSTVHEVAFILTWPMYVLANTITRYRG